jgi:tetratricopeptide (TPR) repeat protein
LLENALAKYTKHYKEPSVKTAWLKVRVAKLYREIGEYRAAEKLIKEALSIYLLYHGYKSLEYAWGLTHLGIIYNKIGDQKQGKKYISKGLEIFYRELKPDHSSIKWAKENLAISLG